MLRTSRLCSCWNSAAYCQGEDLIHMCAALADCICRDAQMPRLRNGDFVCFKKFGAYTSAGAVDFNGVSLS